MTRWGWTGERPQETPSPGWRPGPWRPALWRDLRLMWARMEELAEHVTQTVRSGNQRIERLLIQMSAREDAADARFVELVELVRQGSAAKDAEIAALRAELANAGAEAEARVAAALETDSEFDADKQEAGNTALESLIAVVEEPPAEEEPADPNA